MTSSKQEEEEEEEVVLDELLASIEERRALCQYTREQLRERLREVLLSNENIEWLTQPFRQALLRQEDINKACVQPPRDNARPLLFWLCQWRYWRGTCGWKGADDMVLLALRFGASVELGEEEEEESILATAIRHGTVDTLLHLIRAQQQQTNAQKWIHREMVLSDIWRIALDRACPRILKVLLRYIPATERVWIGNPEQHVTAVDYLLHRLAEWQGSTEDLGECLLLLLQKPGVTCTASTLQILSRLLIFEEHSTEHKIVQLFFGNWLPRSFQTKLSETRRQQQKKRQFQQESKTCVICLEDPKPSLRMTTLYCGHAFCIDCIRQWGASQPERLRATRTVELSCPVCRKALPREVLSNANRRLMGRQGDRKRNTLGVDAATPTTAPRGPQLLTKTQVIIECQARGISVEPSYEDAKRLLVKQWHQVRHQRRNGPNILVDLGTAKSLSPHHVAPKGGVAVIPIRIHGSLPLLAGISGSSPYTVVTPALVQLLGLKVRGLASNEFQRFQQDCPLDKDSDSDDDDDTVFVRRLPTRMQVIDELVISLGQIDVRLRNAVVPCKPLPAWRPGIVLGLDFLESAAWTQTAVEVDVAGSISHREELADRRFMIILHGGMYIYRVADSEERTMPEEFRYYALNGRSFRTPLLHLQPPADDKKSPQLFFPVGHARDRETTSTGRRKAAFTECEWCSRMFHFFPSRKKESNNISIGMVRCGFCKVHRKEHVFYCDEECRQLAHHVHCHRHYEYYGTMATWRRVVVQILIKLLRRQGHVFVVSFLIGFAVSFVGPKPAPVVREIWAQRSLLLPRVE